MPKAGHRRRKKNDKVDLIKMLNFGKDHAKRMKSQEHNVPAAELPRTTLRAYIQGSSKARWLMPSGSALGE